MEKYKAIISDTEISVRKRPVNLVTKDNYLFVSEYLRVIGPSFFEQLSDAYLLGDRILLHGQGRSTTPLKILDLADIYSVNMGLKARISRAISQVSATFHSPLNFDSGIWVADTWSHGYFHWTTECLIKLTSLQKRLENVEVLLPHSYRKHRFIAESLEYLQIPYRFLPSNRLIYTPKLYSASFSFSPGNYSFQLLKEFLNRIRPIDTSYQRPSRRIWISRSLASKRSIVNEAQLHRVLLQYGFEIVNLEEYTFMQQIELFRSTEIVAGLHGAGLTNMVFMAPGGKVIEVRRQNDNHNNCYFALASDLRIKYYYLMATPLDNDLHNGDCILGADALDQFLQKYLNQPE